MVGRAGMMNHEALMREAIAEAAASGDDVPVGALLVDSSGMVVARGHNTREAEHDPTGHAEIVAIREAARARGDWRLDDLTLVVTLEPCVMCAGAIVAARIPRVILVPGMNGSGHLVRSTTCCAIRVSERLLR